MELVNKVAQSGIITLDLELLIADTEIIELDISQFLFKGLLLKEKDFRSDLKSYDWEDFRNKTVAVFCSTDAILAQWAYMLVASYLLNVDSKFYFGTKDEVRTQVLVQKIQQIEEQEYQEKLVVIKGCGNQPLPDAAYLEVTKKLQPVVKSLMFGEPCSTVPIYKKRS